MRTLRLDVVGEAVRCLVACLEGNNDMELEDWAVHMVIQHPRVAEVVSAALLYGYQHVVNHELGQDEPLHQEAGPEPASPFSEECYGKEARR